ncbi:dihydroxyacetone kinase subunit DhaL [Lentibacillus jeotgali]|uniref:dihydroxyacetone kinase subunit DhaL n=1 Tax=Lentibacillus jeotgali TaxID=558169 RepID=UPI000262788F|nr:dihydroxyacetone kinase subunit DhaL [Lentibacillus jeotgali]
MEFTATDLKGYFKVVIDMIEEQKDYLCELDRKIGDGDHGVTMSIGWQAVNDILDDDLKDEDDCGKISMKVGKTFLNAVGSSVGPLYATGLMRGAKTVKKKTILNDQDLVNYWLAFTQGVKERGQAKKGDKTMMDTFEPFAETLKPKFDETHEFVPSFDHALNFAKNGMESTKELVSQKGRSSRLGERSVGFQDPGATSAYLILVTFLNYAKSNSAQVS